MQISKSGGGHLNSLRALTLSQPAHHRFWLSRNVHRRRGHAEPRRGPDRYRLVDSYNGLPEVNVACGSLVFSLAEEVAFLATL